MRQPQEYRKRLKKQLEFLEIGMWDNGVRVKKIKGTPEDRSVFEARLDRGNRIIFTLGIDESIHGSAGNRDAIIYIWGIVSHDDISNKSKTVIPSNAPFLKFKPLCESDTQELILDDLDDSHYTQEYITKKIADDAGSQKWHTLTDTDWERIELYTRDDFDLYLYLTPIQIEVMKTPPPLLLSGTAGSGKTTIGVYYLLKEPLSSLRKLFITYNNYLKIAAERLYAGLLNSDKSAGSYVHPDFFTYKEFCLHTVNRFSNKFLPENEITFERFSTLIRQNRNIARFDIPLLWEEFRAIIKGALPQLNARLFKTAIQKIQAQKLDTGFISILQRQFIIFSNLESSARIEHSIKKYSRLNFQDFLKNFGPFILTEPEKSISIFVDILELFSKQKELTQKKYLSFLEYEMMGKKKAPNFNLDRKEIYRIFEWYQDKLETSALWDELDLTKETITVFNERDMAESQYDLVICDEVQDLTDIQHDLLFYLVKNPLNLILTGDTKQIINPSGFRWEELKQHFYERNLKIPEINFLNLNFRSSGSIVELSNCLLEIKTELLGLSSDQLPEDWKFKNRPPVIVAGLPESEIINNLRTTGAGKTILVRTEEEKEILKALLETELIFTIGEAKGLEFDTVFLWKFCSEKQTSDIWDNILSESHSQIHAAKITHEINLLYVAITRAQKDLLIYDGHSASVIWKNSRIGEKVVISDDVEFINNIWNVLSTPEEWLEQGNYYFEREYYLASIECYKNAGVKDQLFTAEAFYYEKKGNFREAAQRFESLGDLEKAARYYEKCDAFTEALELWIVLENVKQANQCRLKVFERDHNYAALADLYFALKDLPKAAEYYLKNKSYVNAADIYVKLKKHELAAQSYELAGHFDKAAPLHGKAKKYEKAAELFEKIQDYEKAETFWKKAKNTSRLINLYQRTNNVTMLLMYYAKGKDTANAIKLLKKNYSPEKLLEQATEFFNAKQYPLAYLAYQASGDDKGIVKACIQLKRFSEAAHLLEKTGNYIAAGSNYALAKDYTNAFTCFIQSQEDRKDDYQCAKSVAHKVNIHEVGQQFFSKGNFDLALQCSLIDHQDYNSGVCYVLMHQYDKAIEIWTSGLKYIGIGAVARYCLSSNKPDLCARVLFGADPELFERWSTPMTTDDESKLISVMDKYFQNNSSEEEMFIWAERLSKIDRDEYYIGKVCEFYKKSRHYNALYKYIRRIKFIGKKAFSNIKEQFRSEVSGYPEHANELTVLGLYVFEKEAELLQLLSTLEVNNSNYLLFIHSANKEKAIELLIKNESFSTIREFLYENREFLKLAEYCESIKQTNDAAFYYLDAKEYQRAIALFIKLKNFSRAGDIYFELQDYPNALEMYNRHGKNKLKIADALVKLGKYDEAGEIYLQHKKKKKYDEVQRLKAGSNAQPEVTQLKLL